MVLEIVSNIVVDLDHRSAAHAWTCARQNREACQKQSDGHGGRRIAKLAVRPRPAG